MNSPRFNARPAIRRRRSSRPILEEIEARQLLSTATPLYVLGSNANLWLEAPGWQKNGRTPVDSSVKAFVPATDGDVFVEGTDGYLWLEGPNWQASGCTPIDSNVASFAAVPDGASGPFVQRGAGDLYVEGTDGKLWMEGPGWQTSGRTQIDSGVQSFVPDPYAPGYLYVLRTNGQLVMERPGQTSQSPIATGVAAFASDPYQTFALYVQDTSGNLWLVPPSGSSTWIDGNVLQFAVDPSQSGDLYVEGTNDKLWLEAPGWQTNGRTLLGNNVVAFEADPNAPGHLYVEESNTNLYLEAPGWQTNGRTLIDSNVASFAARGPVDPTAAVGNSPAPANAPLFISAYGQAQPSFLDVEQGAAADCWLLASLAEVAAREPQDIKNMFTYDGTTVDNGATVGLYTVRYYNTSGVAEYFQVDTQLPGGGTYYDQVTNAMGTQALWAALAEKAYVEANSLGCVVTNHEYQNDYSALDYGDPAWALQAITGKPAADYSINPTNIAAAWNQGCLIVLCTATPSSSYIVGNHCYALVDYSTDYAATPFEIFNPWGATFYGATPGEPAWAPGDTGSIYGLFWASAGFVSANFTVQSFGSGAIDGKGVDGPVGGPTASATGGYARTGRIDLTLNSPGDRPIIAARPAQVTATGVDLVFALDDFDGDDTLTAGFRARRYGGL
jgi:hypothetical protein